MDWKAEYVQNNSKSRGQIGMKFSGQVHIGLPRKLIRFLGPLLPWESLINGSAMDDTAAEPCQVEKNIYSVSNPLLPQGLGPEPKYLFSLYVPSTVDAKFGMVPYHDVKNFRVNPTPRQGDGAREPNFLKHAVFPCKYS